jgi:hypothetical protein
MKKCPPTRKSGLFLILEFTLNLILDEYWDLAFSLSDSMETSSVMSFLSEIQV